MTRYFETSIRVVYTFQKYTAAAVIHMLFLTPEVSLKIELGLMNPGTNNLSFLVEIRDSTLNGLSQSH